VSVLAVAQDLAQGLVALASEGGEEGAGLTINLFWIIVSAVNFLVFFLLVYRIVLIPVGGMLRDRRERIEQGLRDADAARRDRESAADQRQAVIAEARREASEILTRAQKLSDETREKGIADTQAEIERLRERALVDIDAERKRALADVRGEVAELALLAAGRVVGETMTTEREKRLVDEFLAQVSATAPTAEERN
jgi:F-type H+-transporting ATPase subunit b